MEENHLEPLLSTVLDHYVPLMTILAISGVAYYLSFVKFVSMDEQLFVESLTHQQVVDGPQVVYLNPFKTKKCEVRKAVSLSPLEYCIVKNILSGEQRVEVGPKLVRLKAYDEIQNANGSSVDGDGRIRKALSLKANEYVRFIDNKTGKVRVVRGEMGCVVPGANEEYLDAEGKLKALDLKVYEYVKIQNKQTGELRTERGEKLVFLGPFEELLGGRHVAAKKSAIEVDDETAVLVRNKRSGQLKLVTEKMLFVPSNDEEVAKVQKLIKLANYEACIIRDKSGKDLFYFGSNEDQRSFFLPPHSQLVNLTWSRGRRREHRDLIITKLDLRPMYMSFEFNCRTNDNVELVLEGSFFWQVVDVKAMVQFTNDTSRDICNHARSGFIQLVSQVTLREFMTKFNTIAKQVHEDDEFYKQRGVKIHSLEVTGYRCAETSTAQILEQIIQETTNRMNRLQQQESQNEVQLQEIRGDIEEEKAKQELIEIQTLNSNAKSKMEGMAEAEKVKSFLDQLSKEFPDMGRKEQISLWNTLRKEDALRVIAGAGNASLYFTPADVNLSIENHKHILEEGKAKKSAAAWADDSVSED